jgi:hypothetical protein
MPARRWLAGQRRNGEQEEPTHADRPAASAHPSRHAPRGRPSGGCGGGAPATARDRSVPGGRDGPIGIPPRSGCWPSPGGQDGAKYHTAAHTKEFAAAHADRLTLVQLPSSHALRCRSIHRCLDGSGEGPQRGTREHCTHVLGLASVARISLGVASNIADVYRFLECARTFLDSEPDLRDLPPAGTAERRGWRLWAPRPYRHRQGHHLIPQICRGQPRRRTLPAAPRAGPPPTL